MKRWHTLRWSLLAVACFVCAASAQTQTQEQRAKSAAAGANTKYGSDQALNDNAMAPMSSDKQMTTVDGSASFGAKTSCPGSQQYLSLTAFPNSTNDIGRLAVSIDANFDGVQDSNAMLVGPYAAVCSNGMISCPAGTNQNCKFFQWRASGSGVILDPNNANGQPNTQQDLGACYCINNSCGSNLLIQNSKKILSDIGTGITVALQANYPRLTIASTEQADPMTQVFYGSQSGCSSDNKPEQYFSNPAAATAAGQAIANDPTSTYGQLVNSPAAKGHTAQQQSCKVYRQIDLSSWQNDGVIGVAFNPSGAGAVTSCGTGCVIIQVGSSVGWGGGNCQYHVQTASVTVNRPQLITSATLQSITYDDWGRFKVNGNIVWNVRPSWTDDSPICGENGNRGTKTVNVDITSAFTSTPAGATLELRDDTSTADGGGGRAFVKVTYAQDCKLASEAVVDQCGVQEDNPDCSIASESVDGVTTVANYFGTGLQPLPSQRTYALNGCSQTYTRDFWNKDRVYVCKTQAPDYDGADAKKRYNSIHSTFDPDSGNYTDTTKDSSGNWTTSSNSIPLVPKQAVPACTQTCKTKKPRPGAAMGSNGAVTDLNATGVAWDYTYKQCSDDSTCPLDSGETMVSGCNCDSNFNEAATMMQNIRMMGQDTVCAPAN